MFCFTEKLAMEQRVKESTSAKKQEQRQPQLQPRKSTRLSEGGDKTWQMAVLGNVNFYVKEVRVILIKTHMRAHS